MGMKELSALKRLAEGEEKENAAIKVRQYGGSPHEGSKISPMMRALMLYLSNVPTEIEVPITDKWDVQDEYFSDLADMAKEAGMPAQEAVKLMSDARHSMFNEVQQDLYDNLKAETDEIIEHLTTLLKAKVLKVAHESDQLMFAEMKKARADALTKIAEFKRAAK